jgi:uncharacterized protein (TIGR03067 family)
VPRRIEGKRNWFASASTSPHTGGEIRRSADELSAAERQTVAVQSHHEGNPLRRLSLLSAILLVAPLLGSDSPRGYSEAAESFGIEGSWELTGFVSGGEKTTPNFRAVITCRGGAFTCEYSTGDTVRGAYHTDTAGRPPHLDWLPANGTNKGREFKFVYQLNGDALLVAGQGDGTQRPHGFNDRLVLVSCYKRIR